MNTEKIYDFIAVGIGPFNLSLAALAAPLNDLSCLFFESKAEFNWHPGLLMEDTTLQVPMMADLVTMVDPTSHYSYLNYLHHQSRLYHFYFYEKFLIPRIDYNQYCRWVATQLPCLQFSYHVESICDVGSYYELQVRDIKQQIFILFKARQIVMGTGTVPSVPSVAQDLVSDTCVHSTDYLQNKTQLQQKSRIVLVGGGQSAAEIYLDLFNEQPQHDYQLDWYTRNAGFLPMEYSKLGLEHFSPDYIDYFYQLNQSKRDEIRAGQDLWYKGISSKTIADIYGRLYVRSLQGPLNSRLQARTELKDVQQHNGEYLLRLNHKDQNMEFEQSCDALILATGFAQHIPQCLETLQAAKDDRGRLQIERDYNLSQTGHEGHRVYVQNAELHSHGIGAPDLGLGAYRSAHILNSVCGYEIYTLRQQNVFQQFGVSTRQRGNSVQKLNKGAAA